MTNYRVFRARLGVPLVTVELSFDGEFALGHDDADVLVRIEGGAVLWQKERLLNVALAAVPPRFGTIAWLDSDVVFGDDDWAAAACRALDDVRLVHLYHYWKGLHDGLLPDDGPGAVGETKETIVRRYGCDPISVRRSPAPESPGRKRIGAWGLGWAARRELLERHRFYDACIVGGADMAMACAALGDTAQAIDRLAMNAAQRDHYLEWARGFGAAVDGRVGYLDGDAYHLWHGALSDRRYDERGKLLAGLGFDPREHIAVGESGSWHWRCDNEGLKAFLVTYLSERREDGPAAFSNSVGVRA